MKDWLDMPMEILLVKSVRIERLIRYANGTEIVLVKSVRIERLIRYANGTEIVLVKSFIKDAGKFLKPLLYWFL